MFIITTRGVVLKEKIKMNDSENEISNNIFSYPNVNATVSAKGPNTNISNLSIRQQLTSTMYNMPRNFERQRYAQSVCDQGSMYYRRETSPMSTRSAYRRETSPMSTRSVCDMRPFNFQPYFSGMSSRQSMYHGRSGSPASMRSIDSTASFSAKEIAFAIKNMKYNSHDIQIIKHAYRDLMKFRTRKRFERKRNLRMFLKRNMNSGDDSGEQGSDSSISDDGRSAKTTTSKVSNNITNFELSNRQFDNSNFGTVKENFIRDSTVDARHNKFKNMYTISSASVSNSINSAPKPNNVQKDRFKSSFLLPSHRFNQSVASTIIPENFERQHKSKNLQSNTMLRVKNHFHQRPNHEGNTDSEDEEIFSETVKENTVFRTESQHKRSLHEDELNLPYNKRKKISSPIKKTAQKEAPVANNKNNKNVNTFEFVKPTLPAIKVKPKIQQKLISYSQAQEILIAKSSQPLTDIIDPGPSKPKDTEIPKQPHVQEKTNMAQLEQHETLDNTDVSMRPSFIKRKLFTQKLDVIEKSNMSSDGVNSPQNNVYSGMPKEKNKARKLVTTQSCLNREVEDDNNLLDLIHKIVPPDQMNATSQSSVNQTRLNAIKPDTNKNKDNDDKWDVTAVILTCNEDEGSDTYTDEEIFKSDNKTIDTNPKGTKEASIVPCRVVLADVNKSKEMNNFKSNDVTTKKLQNTQFKSFWDTDTESDVDWHESLHRRNVKDNRQCGNIPLQRSMQETKNTASNLSIAKTPAIPETTKSLYNNTAVNTTMNSSIDTVQKLKVGNVSFRSHRISKKMTCCKETGVNDTKPIVEPRNKYLIDTTKPLANTQKQHSVPKSDTKSDCRNKATKDNIKTKSTKDNALTKDKATKDNIRTKSTKDNALTKDRSASNTRKITNNKSKQEDTIKTTSDESKPKKSSRSKVENVKPVQITNRTTKVTKTTEKLNNNDVNNKNTNLSNGCVTSSVLDSTVDTTQNGSTRSQRPLRTCRANSQNRSLELSNSLHLSNNSSFTKNLRSRTIDLSSSIDNTLTFNIKPRTNVVNKTVAAISNRTSDVSFSIGNKNTTSPKRVVRNKGKRKT